MSINNQVIISLYEYNHLQEIKTKYSKLESILLNVCNIDSLKALQGVNTHNGFEYIQLELTDVLIKDKIEKHYKKEIYELQKELKRIKEINNIKKNKLEDKEHEVKMLKFELSVIKSKTRELITWKGFIKYKIKNEIRRINKKVRHIFS